MLHSRQTMYESLFADKTSAAYEYYSQMHGKWGIQNYAINSMLYLRMIKDKYIEIYNEFISQLHIYAKALRILAKSYLPILLITPINCKKFSIQSKRHWLKLIQIMITLSKDYTYITTWN